MVVIMSSTVESRLHYFDNLRALAMMAGVIFHASLAYSLKLHGLWLTGDRQQSEWFDIFAWFFHIFRMPLFFIIAGFFVALLINKRGMKGMLWNRTKRVLFPFLIFFPIVAVAILADIIHVLSFVQHKSPVLELIAQAMATPGTPPPPPSTMHLWFLYNLMMFCVVAWALSYLSWEWVTHLYQKMKALFLLCFFPALLIPALFFGGAPYLAPDSFFPQLWSFGFFGLFFGLGIFIFSQKNSIDELNPYWVILLLMSILFYVVFYRTLPTVFSFPAAEIAFSLKLFQVTLEAYIAVWMSVVCLVIGKKYLNVHNRYMRFFSESSYWIYLIHFPLIVSVQYRLMDKDWSLLAKFGATLAITFGVGALSYVLLVRWTPIGWLLNGRKKSVDQLPASL